ncbi:MAG: hypothetical protein ACYDAL_16280 [Candidatus Dormibacteraceae bacterium]
MGALIAIGSIFTLLWVKHHALGTQAVPAAQAGGTPVKITGAPDPNTAYDPTAPAQADPIGNTHLSVLDPIFTPGGDIVALPYRPSDVAYGGGVQSAVGTSSDANPAGSTGSGISAIEVLNAPAAGRGLSASGGSRLPRISFHEQAMSQLMPVIQRVFSGGAAQRTPAANNVLKATNAVTMPTLGAVAGSGAPANHALRRAISQPVAPATIATSAKPTARVNYLLAGRRLSVV